MPGANFPMSLTDAIMDIDNNRELEQRQERKRIVLAVEDHAELFSRFYQGVNNGAFSPLLSSLLDECVQTLRAASLSENPAKTPAIAEAIVAMVEVLESGPKTWKALMEGLRQADVKKKLKFLNKFNMQTLKDKNRPCAFEKPLACLEIAQLESSERGCELTPARYCDKWDEWFSAATAEGAALSSWWAETTAHFGPELVAMWKMGLKVYDTLVFTVCAYAARGRGSNVVQVLLTVKEIQDVLPWCLPVQGIPFLQDVVLGTKADIICLDECEFLFGAEEAARTILFQQMIERQGYHLFATKFFDDTRDRALPREISICVSKQLMAEMQIEHLELKFQNSLFDFCLTHASVARTDVALVNELSKNCARAQAVRLTPRAVNTTKNNAEEDDDDDAVMEEARTKSFAVVAMWGKSGGAAFELWLSLLIEYLESACAVDGYVFCMDSNCKQGKGEQKLQEHFRKHNINYDHEDYYRTHACATPITVLKERTLFQTQLCKIDAEDVGRKDYIVASHNIQIDAYKYRPEGLTVDSTKPERNSMILPNDTHPTDHALITAECRMPGFNRKITVGQINLGGRNENPFEFKIPTVCLMVP